MFIQYLHQPVCHRLDNFAAADSPLVRIDKIPHCPYTISPSTVFLRYCANDQCHYYRLISIALVCSHNPYDVYYFDYCLIRIGIPVMLFHHEICTLVLRFSLIPD